MAEHKHLVSSSAQQLYADPAAAAAQAVDKIAAARVWLLKEKPFFGVLSRALVIEPTLGVPAFRLAADDRLLANPLVVLEMKFPSLCARMAHLCLHAALGALVRRGPRDPLRWNVAHDLAIEPLLRAAQLPSGVCAPQQRKGAVAGSIASDSLPDGASAEEHYLLLPEGTLPDDHWCDLADSPPPPGPPPLAGSFRKVDDDNHDPGDDEGGNPQNEAGETEREPREPSELPSVEARTRELQWKMRLAAALEEELASGGKTFGEVPAWIDELVRATIEPPPSFAASLQRSVSMLTRTGRSFLRPSRRMSALVGPDGQWPEIVTMPGRRVQLAGRLASVIDTSASIDGGILMRFLGTLAAVATAEGFDEVRLVQADADVTHDATVLAAELLLQDVAIVGRGGTDFGPALRKLSEESLREGERFTVVYLTDLDGRFPAASEVRPLEVLWVVPGKPMKPPPFGTLVEMALQNR